MPRQSAGILLYRRTGHGIEVLLVHPGGPFWEGRDLGAWTIPKGELCEGEDALACARREFQEETGGTVEGPFIALAPVRQKAGKIVQAWAAEGDFDPTKLVSNTFRVQWPYKSGKWIRVPEVDEAGWFTPEEARQKLNPAQVALVEELLTRLPETAGDS